MDNEILLLKNDESTKKLLYSEDTCDKYDYLTAVACGAIGGMIDIFFVGAPNDSKLGKWTDKQVDNAVKGFAKLTGWTPKDSQKDNVASAIGYLEKKFKVNYDQRYSSDVQGLFHMSTKNHHIMSLSHSPDIIGLFFSILNQFTSTSSFIANGQVITIKTETYELQGHTFIAKLFCGIANWFGHIMSDIAGSSGSRGNNGRGTGISIPFFELLQFCKFGSFSVGKDKQDLATIAIRAFQEGYDFRYGLATAIPVIITDLSIRLIWSIRQHFQYHKPLMNCIPTKKHASLRVMLLFGDGTLCLMDGIDAGVRSGGNALVFFTRLNLIAWFRFAFLVFKEVCIRVGLANTLETDINAYKKITEALTLYLQELEKIDIARFKKETEEYNALIKSITDTSSDKELNRLLVYTIRTLGIEIPWGDDFNGFMNDKSKTLVFK
ncbi:MAG: hypothetical protein KH230_11275 [Enterocloster asparagiformis]|nr:hypothetical protein [Enterocloster asparagiformis]